MEEKESYKPGEIFSIIKQYNKYKSALEKNNADFKETMKTESSSYHMYKIMIEIVNSNLAKDNEILENCRRNIPNNVLEKTGLEKKINNHIVIVKNTLEKLNKLKESG